MKTELSVMNRLAEVISTQLNDFLKEDEDYSGLLDEISEKNVVIDFPDIDNMPKNTMFYIEPESEDIEDATTCSDVATMYLTIYILCKRDTNERLIKKVYGYFTALYCLLRSNQDLDRYIDFSRVASVEYYPAVTATGNIAGIETGIRLSWEKDFSYEQ